MVRTRFAPSPTGYMHIGNLRAALYAYLAARHYGGVLVLRIEDTDRRRNVEDAVQVIYDSLRLAGLDYDEGPDKGGDYGPYIQSQRRPIYKEHAERLVELGAAYRCFCGKVEAEASRESVEEGDEAVEETPVPVRPRRAERRPLRRGGQDLRPMPLPRPRRGRPSRRGRRAARDPPAHPRDGRHDLSRPRVRLDLLA